LKLVLDKAHDSNRQKDMDGKRALVEQIIQIALKDPDVGGLGRMEE